MEWKDLREAFPADHEAQYLVRIEKDGFTRFFVCVLTETAWEGRPQLRGCSYDGFNFVYDEPSGEPEQPELIPDPDAPAAYWMPLDF